MGGYYPTYSILDLNPHPIGIFAPFWVEVDGQVPASKALIFFTMVTVKPFAEHCATFRIWLHEQVIHMMHDGV